MEFEENHDRFTRKNASLSRAWELEKKDKYKEKLAKGEIKPETVACYKCKKLRPCLKYTIMETTSGKFEGVVSVSNEMVPLCEECSPRKMRKENQLDSKQIKSLLKGAKRGRL